jgi:RNA polymerase sigma-70 factor (ECF subfamily)
MESNEHKNTIIETAYRDHSDSIFRFCVIQTRNRDLAKDILQDVFIKTWEYLVAGNSVDNLKAFLFRVARNAIIDASRKKKTSSLDILLEDGFEPADPQNELLQHEIRLDFENALDLINDLDPMYQEPIVLRYVEDMAIKDIAKILDEKENTISVRIHRGIEMLQKKIQSQESRSL